MCPETRRSADAGYGSPAPAPDRSARPVRPSAWIAASVKCDEVHRAVAAERQVELRHRNPQQPAQRLDECPLPLVVGRGRQLSDARAGRPRSPDAPPDSRAAPRHAPWPVCAAASAGLPSLADRKPPRLSSFLRKAPLFGEQQMAMPRQCARSSISTPGSVSRSAHRTEGNVGFRRCKIGCRVAHVRE